jgi:hypothetical protein
MTNEQINAAIQMALGNPLGCPRCSDSECAYNSGINYSTDLNAMHEAEKVLKGYEQIATYVWHLENRSGDWSTDWSTDEHMMATHATARQRAEAFLRTLGKWEEAVVKGSFTTEEAE